MTTLTEQFEDALQWASALHRGQPRKGSSTPYVAHVLAVAALVLEDGGSEDTAIAALLHDAIEDCGVTEEDLRRRFGNDVAVIVSACTDTNEHPKPPWRPRKEAYLRRLAAPDTDVRAVQVSAADKIHNVTSMVVDHAVVGDALWSQFSAPPHDLFWYHEAVERIARDRLPESTLPARLHDAIAGLRRIVSPPRSTG